MWERRVDRPSQSRYSQSRHPIAHRDWLQTQIYLVSEIILDGGRKTLLKVEEQHHTPHSLQGHCHRLTWVHARSAVTYRCSGLNGNCERHYHRSAPVAVVPASTTTLSRWPESCKLRRGNGLPNWQNCAPRGRRSWWLRTMHFMTEASETVRCHRRPNPLRMDAHALYPIHCGVRWVILLPKCGHFLLSAGRG